MYIVSNEMSALYGFHTAEVFDTHQQASDYIEKQAITHPTIIHSVAMFDHRYFYQIVNYEWAHDGEYYFYVDRLKLTPEDFREGAEYCEQLLSESESR